MGHRSTAEKILLLLTTVGGLLTVGALALFALAGPGFVVDLLRHAAGFTLGLIAASFLTRSPEHGGRIAALLLLASLAGTILLVLVIGEPAATGQGRDNPEFIIGFLVSVAMASVWRLLGINPMGPPGDQASRRRS